MIKVTYVSADGKETCLTGEAGDTIMRLAGMNGLNGIIGECGGSMMCATCHCHVDPAWANITGARSPSEEDMLDCAASPMDERSRLGCQITLTAEMDGLIVHLPATQR